MGWLMAEQAGLSIRIGCKASSGKSSQSALRRDSDLFGAGAQTAEAQNRFRASFERGFQTRDAEMDLARLLGKCPAVDERSCYQGQTKLASASRGRRRHRTLGLALGAGCVLSGAAMPRTSLRQNFVGQGYGHNHRSLGDSDGEPRDDVIRGNRSPITRRPT